MCGLIIMSLSNVSLVEAKLVQILLLEFSCGKVVTQEAPGQSIILNLYRFNVQAPVLIFFFSNVLWNNMVEGHTFYLYNFDVVTLKTSTLCNGSHNRRVVMHIHKETNIHQKRIRSANTCSNKGMPADIINAIRLLFEQQYM